MTTPQSATSLSTIVTLPGQAVTSVGTVVTLPRPALPAGFTRTSDLVRSELKDKLHFMENCSSFSLGFEVKAKLDLVERFKETFLDVRDFVLNEEGQEDGLEKINDFTVDFGLQVATYTDPETGDKHTVDLMTMNHPLLTSLFDVADEILHFRKDPDFQVSKQGRKGNLKGEIPLIRKAKACQSLPSQFEECAKRNVPKALALEGLTRKDRMDISKRILFSELVHVKFPPKLRELITEKRRDYEAAVNGHAERKVQNQIKREVVQLQELYQKLTQLDPYALTTALSIYPVKAPIDPEDIQERAEKLEKGLWRELNSWKNDEHEEKLDYMRDLIGMLHLNRWDYHAYCQKHHIRVKQEGVADVYMRAAILYAETEDMKEVGQEFVSGLCEDFSDDLKAKIQSVIESIDCSKIQIQDGELDFEAKAPIPPGASPRSKDAILGKWAGLACGDLIKIRKRLWETPPALPAPSPTLSLPAPSSTSLSLPSSSRGLLGMTRFT